MRKFTVALVAVFVAALAVLAGKATAADVTVVATGLDSPRGLTFMPNGTLAVAEAGHGGDVCIPGRPCVGLTGEISTVNLATGSHAPLVSGLISVLDPEGGAIGVDGLSSQGGRLLAIMGANPAPLEGASCDGLPGDCPAVFAAARSQLGQLLKVSASGRWKTVAGVGAYDYDFTAQYPGGDVYGHEVDSNPYGLLALPSGTYVADAGSNTLDWVGNNGSISIVNRFPVPSPMEPFPTDGVPTCVAQGANGLVVADLAGRIWTESSSGWMLTSGQGRGDHYTGCAADAAGNVYIVSMFNSSGGPFPNPGTGSVVELSAAGGLSTVVDHLVFPNGIAVGADGALYATVNSVMPTGEIVRITP